MTEIPPDRKDCLVDAVRAAGACLFRLWPGASADVTALDVRKKSDGSVVSIADLESNRMLTEAIVRLYPDDAILSEEVPPDVQRLTNAKRIWIIDPLDGTSSFVNGRDDFSVLVALVEDGRPTFGVMFFPARDVMVIAGESAGVTRNGIPIRVSDQRNLSAGRVYIRNFECNRPQVASPMMDSGLAFLKVASGDLDGAIIRMTTHQEWDLAAPCAVLEAAGGRMFTESGTPPAFGRGTINYRYLIASNGLVDQELCGLLP